MRQAYFSELALLPALHRSLLALDFRTMTPVQEQSLPHILQGGDLIAQAKTGSGKTAAFGLGLLQKLDLKLFLVQSLVLCPTRELSDQVAKEIRRLARNIKNVKVLTLCGGVPLGPQIGSLQHGAHVVIGTPGRILKHLKKGTLNLDNLNTLVLDEADRMLDMGFQVELDAILEKTPKLRQTLLFSATFPQQIEVMASRVMEDPTMVRVEERHDSTTIRQHLYRVDDDDRRADALIGVLLHFKPESALVFCNTKKDADDLARVLCSRGFAARALHGDMEQKKRDQTLVQFANRSATVLVATDVAARGLDIEQLDVVINYHIARDCDIHLHRIGRTGRAGNKGLACTLYSIRESQKLERLKEYLNQNLETESLPPKVSPVDFTLRPSMMTLQIDGGKKQKLSPGDILGALTGDGGIAGGAVGKIDIFYNCSYVAIRRDLVGKALQKLRGGKLKGRVCRARRID